MYKAQGMYLNIRQMLLPIFLADFIAMVHDRCYCHGIMADVIALHLFVLWQMLLPCSDWQMLLPILRGRCQTTSLFFNFLQQVWMAEVIAQWQMQWPLLHDFIQFCGRCYSHGSWSYFNFSSEVLNRTSFQMWGRWYLPMFLLRDGLLTLMYSASFIALLRFWSSLPTILKLSVVTWWPVLLLWS